MIPFRGRWLLLLIPAALFAGIAVLMRCGVLPEPAGNVLTGLLILPLAAGGFLLLMFFIFQTAGTTVTDPVYYETALAKNGYPKNAYLAPFPEQIPQDAGEVSFRYFPQFLQGGSECSLSVRLTPEEQRELTEEFCKNAVWHGTADDYRRMNPLSGNVPYTPDDPDAVLWILLWDRENALSRNHGKVCLLWTVPDGRTVWYHSVW